jgi:hypothetical protein
MRRARRSTRSAMRWCASCICRCAGPNACRHWPHAASRASANAARARCSRPGKRIDKAVDAPPSASRPDSTPPARTGAAGATMNQICKAKSRWSPAPAAASARRSPTTGRATALRSSAPRPANPARSDRRAPGRARRGRVLDVADAQRSTHWSSGRKEFGAVSHSRQQRRHHPRQPADADEGRGLGAILNTNLSSVFRTSRR